MTGLVWATGLGLGDFSPCVTGLRLRDWSHLVDVLTRALHLVDQSPLRDRSSPGLGFLLVTGLASVTDLIEKSSHSLESGPWIALLERPTSGIYRDCPDMTPRKSPGYMGMTGHGATTVLEAGDHW